MIADKTMGPAAVIKPANAEGIHPAMMQYRSFTSAFVLILSTVLCTFLIQHIGLNLAKLISPGNLISFLIMIAAAGAIVYFRQELFWILTSYQFAVSILATSSAATILGTFIIQHGAVEDYYRVYGTLIGGLIQNFFLYDLFHSFWFASLLILTAVSLFLVLVKRNPFRATQWGFLLSHGGIILILAGAIGGYFTSESGMINLNEGQSANSVVLTKNGALTGFKRDLGFDLKLQDFQVEYYPAEYKIYAYRLDSAKKEYTAEGSYKLKQGKKYKIPGTDTTLFIRSAESGDTASAQILASGPNGMYEATLTDHPTAPTYLNHGEIAVLIDKRNQEAKDYRSILSIYENGIERKRATVQVNQPLKYKGFTFYQANFDPENPAYSGIQMVRDPALGFVYAGFVMMSLGVIFIFYIRPRMVEAGRRKQEALYAA